MNNFQTILLAIFLAFFVFAVLIFSGILPIGNKTSSTTPKGDIVIWGTFPDSDFQKVFESLEGVGSELRLVYVQKSESEYQQALVESFANDTGPDLFFITPDMIMKNKNYIFTIPFTSYPEKTFRDTFIDGADIYLSQDGIIGLPVVVDPLVLYYNKDILANNGIAKVPEYWDELFDLNKSLTVKKNDVISQSMIGLGRFDNVTHAKDILAMLLIQSGNPIIQRNQDKFTSVLNSNMGLSTSPAEDSLKFFSQFADPTYQAYSWNRTLPESKDFFTGGKLAFYIGKASELFNIQSINPNLSFDVSPVLQTKGTNVKKTFGNIYALAVNKKSLNSTNAFLVSGLLSTGNNDKNIAISLSLPLATRALLASKPADPYMFSFFDSAIISKAWLDPNSNLTNQIFKDLLENIISNKLSISSAVSKAQSQLELLLK